MEGRMFPVAVSTGHQGGYSTLALRCKRGNLRPRARVSGEGRAMLWGAAPSRRRSRKSWFGAFAPHARLHNVHHISVRGMPVLAIHYPLSRGSSQGRPRFVIRTLQQPKLHHVSNGELSVVVSRRKGVGTQCHGDTAPVKSRGAL